MVDNASNPWRGEVKSHAAGSGVVRTETRTGQIAAALQNFTYDDDGNLTGDGTEQKGSNLTY